MVQPNFIPRTLRGVGGVRLINLPGVEYPPEMLHVRQGHNRRDGRPYEQRPSWGISTREAAVILRCSTSAARLALHKHRIRCRAVREPGTSVGLYWDRNQVAQLAEKRYPIVKEVSGKLVTPAEACALLRVGRSSLHRYALKRWLHPQHVRVETAAGLRHRVYYRRAEVVKLGHHIRALRVRMAEMQQLLQEMASGGEGGQD